jgi:hypothetical protein
MKTFNTSNLYVGFLLALTISMMSCSKSTPLSPQDQTKNLLIGSPGSSSTPATWTLQSESVDGVDQSTMFKGFTITFTQTGFTTTNGGGIWPASGTWSFQGTSTTTITRNDGTNVQIQVSSSSLVMTITWTITTFGPGRTESTKGVNIFTMIK